MTTIILTIIGILLAAAAALMAIWYGGDAFGTGDVRAKSALLLSAGRNVRAAYAGYAMDGVPATSLSQLRTASASGVWLQEEPVITGAGTSQEVADLPDGWFYRVTGVPEDVCAFVQRVANGGALVPAQPGGRARGCAGPQGARFFYARLDAPGFSSGRGGASGGGTTPAS